MTSTKQPSAEEVAAARELLTRAATSEAEASQEVLIRLVTMPEFSAVLDQMRKAQALNPASTDIAYTLSMLERLRAAHTPR